ncbi:MAG: inorganic diphosphatase [Pyrinomonadaceae bacterium]
MSKNTTTGISSLEVFDKKNDALNVVVETPKGSRNKYTYDEETGIFKLGGILPLGASFPFDFGFIPQTLGGDGDPLDVLLLMDEPAFAGCLVPARLVGVIEADQTEDGKTIRNDRLIAVACKSITHDHVRQFNDLNENLIEQIKHFFVSYNEAKGKKFEPRGDFGARKAENLIVEGNKLYLAKKRRTTKTAGK